MTTQRLLKIQNTSITQAWQIVPGAMTVNSRTKIGQSAALVKLASLVMKQANLANTGELHVFSFATCATAGFFLFEPEIVQNVQIPTFHPFPLLIFFNECDVALACVYPPPQQTGQIFGKCCD